MDEQRHDDDDFCWHANADWTPPESHRARVFFPRLRHCIQLLLVFVRMTIFTIKEWWQGRESFINIFQQMRAYRYTAMPLGSIGSGSIGRDYRGGFCKFTLTPGLKEQHTKPIKANQFILTVHSAVDDHRLLYQRCLTAADFRHDRDVLSSWRTDFPASNIHYRALFPRAWMTFSIPELSLDLECEEMSPVLPNDYDDSALPTSLFTWRVRNASSQPLHVTLTFTWRNGTGDKRWQSEAQTRSVAFRDGQYAGIELRHSIARMPTNYAIAIDNEQHDESAVETCAFDPSGDGRQLWEWLETGVNHTRLLPPQPPTSAVNARQLGVALSARRLVAPSDSGHFKFVLIWHQPVVRFLNGLQRRYRRRYTRRWGTATDDNTVSRIAAYALQSADTWRSKIEQWQRPILADASLPVWFKTALFNELYYLVDGGTCWFEFDDDWLVDEPNMSSLTVDHFKRYGRFGYLESWEYHMINTYDVHFYAAFALLVAGWPQIELSIQLDFCDQLNRVDDRASYTLHDGIVERRKRAGRMPHDLGHPYHDPFAEVNAYMLHDTGDWKDLNLKFVLASARALQLVVRERQIDESEDDRQERIRQTTRHFYDTMKTVIELGLREWDTDSDGMIENSGWPDQTYDVWTMKGTSAYCGSLWLASLWTIVETAKLLDLNDDALRYSSILMRARSSFQSKLWNGEYYSFDERPQNARLVMADQLLGFWSVRSLLPASEPLPPELATDGDIVKALLAIHRNNVAGFEHGQLGAVNGIFENHQVDHSYVQSEEVWTGVTYAIASHLIMTNHRDEGFSTAEGLWRRCWERWGLQWQTPESVCADGMYRAIGYMRPLSIWSMLLAHQKRTPSQ